MSSMAGTTRDAIDTGEMDGHSTGGGQRSDKGYMAVLIASDCRRHMS